MTILPIAGKPTVLIADPSLAAQLIRDSKLSARQLTAEMNRVALGAPRTVESDALDTAGSPRWGGFNISLPWSKISSERNSQFDTEAQWFKEKGYNVIRIPKLVVGENKIFNYSNNFVETDEHGITVSCPYYGIKPLEDDLVKKLKNLGVTVRFYNGFQSASGDAGSHCETNETRTHY